MDNLVATHFVSYAFDANTQFIQLLEHPLEKLKKLIFASSKEIRELSKSESPRLCTAQKRTPRKQHHRQKSQYENQGEQGQSSIGCHAMQKDASKIPSNLAEEDTTNPSSVDLATEVCSSSEPDSEYRKILSCLTYEHKVATPEIDPAENFLLVMEYEKDINAVMLVIWKVEIEGESLKIAQDIPTKDMLIGLECKENGMLLKRENNVLCVMDRWISEISYSVSKCGSSFEIVGQYTVGGNIIHATYGKLPVDLLFILLEKGENRQIVSYKFDSGKLIPIVVHPIASNFQSIFWNALDSCLIGIFELNNNSYLKEFQPMSGDWAEKNSKFQVKELLTPPQSRKMKIGGLVITVAETGNADQHLVYYIVETYSKNIFEMKPRDDNQNLDNSSSLAVAFLSSASEDSQQELISIPGNPGMLCNF